MRFSCRICSTKYHFPCAGGSGLGRSAYSPPHLPLQVPHAPSQPAAGSESRRFANKHSKKALKASLTLGILLGMFFVAWLPFFVTNVTQVSKFLGFLLAEIGSCRMKAKGKLILFLTTVRIPVEPQTS